MYILRKMSGNSVLQVWILSLKKLEAGGLLISFLEGKTRVVQWNSKYPSLDIPKAFSCLIFSESIW